MKIIYNSENDIKDFDLERYYKSLNRYGKVSREDIEKELKHWNYDPLHYSCLVEIGVKLLPTELTAREYWEDHKIEGRNFLRLVRVTGYLTGDYRRANDAKLHEFAERTVNGKTGKNGVFSPDEKDMREASKLAYAEIAAQVGSKV